MLKKKLTSIVLAIAMLMSLSAVSVSASGTDAIKEVITDSTSYTEYAHQFNRLHTNTYNLTSYTAKTLGTDIGSEGNVCAKFTAESATITSESRFDTNKVIYDGVSTSSNTSIGPATYPTDIMYWSLDVWGNTDIDSIQFKSRGGITISPVISNDALKADQWNTLTVIMHPNTTDSTYMGNVDLFINGEFVSNTDKSSQQLAAATNTTMDQLRFSFKFTSTSSILYVDNAKVGLLTSFTRPAVASTGDITVADKVISNYGSTTVSALESTLGVEILTAEGTAADADAKVESGMKAVVSNTIANVGTFTTEYTFGADGTTGVKKVITDTTSFTQLAHQYNRTFSTVQNTEMKVYSSIGGDSNVCAGFTLESTTATDVRWHANYVTPKYDSNGSPAELTSGTDYGSYNIAAATSPVYWSVDVYGNNITDIRMQVGSVMMHDDKILTGQLKANQWNTLSIMYYPNSTDTTKCGYADLYINNVFQGTKDLSSVATTTEQTRFYYMFTNPTTTEIIYFDNLKLYEMNSFVRPDIKEGVDVTGGKITGYLTSTVGALETATGANIVNADGTDADASAVATEGMKAVVTGEVEGIGTFTTEYELGSPDKVLATEDFSSTSSYKDVLSDRIGFDHAVESGALKITTTSQDDGSDGTKDIRFAVINTADGDKLNPGDGDPLVYSIDLKPAAGMQSLRFDTSGQKWADELPASYFNIGEWNSIKMVFYKTAISLESGWEADIYVNNKLVSRGYRNSSETYDTNALRFHIITAATGDVYYIDNLEVTSATGFARPEISSTVYTVGHGSGTSPSSINGYKDMTVEKIEAGAVLDSDETFVVYNADGTEAADATVADSTLYAVVTKGDYSYTYSFGVADYAIGSWTTELKDEEVDGATVKKLYATLPVANYIASSPVTLTVIIAEFNGDRFVNATLNPVSVSTADGYAAVNCVYTAGNTYKLFAWDSTEGSLTPMKAVEIFSE